MDKQALLDKYGATRQILDHGHVRLVDVMGDDNAIVQMARVSYGEGTKTVSSDRGLIRYLMRHRHTSPFEGCEIKLHAKMPMFVARQWVRHRTACLAGDARLSFDLPGAEKRNRRQHYPVRIDEFHRMWHEGLTHRTAKKKPLHLDRVDPDTRYTVPELSRLVERREEELRNTVRAHLAKMKLRMCDEATGEIAHTRVVDVWASGVKPVFEVTLENGKCLKMSRDHRCLTDAGWLTLGEATQLRLREDGGVTWCGDGPAFAVNGVALHRSAEWLQAQKQAGHSVSEMATAAGVSYHTIRKHLKQHGLQFTPSERARSSGRSQRGQKRQVVRPRVLSEDARRRIREARSGPRSNFWKGGVTKERANIGRWTTEQAKRVHAANGFRCVVCADTRDLETHHIDPVWNNPARGRDPENLTTLCQRCHKTLHTRHLGLIFLEDHRAGVDLRGFWDRHADAAPDRPEREAKPPIRRLWRGWSRIAKIEYVGEEMTYDLEVAGPYHNFVANGFVVHNSLNEISARYSQLPNEFYVPTPDRWQVQSKDNKQGSGATLPPELAATCAEELTAASDKAYADYEALLERGVAREIARATLPVNFYTEWYWKIDLHNLLHFLSLRMHHHAQYEIRVYADAIAEIVQDWVPHTWEAFSDYRLGGAFLSRSGLEVTRRLIAGQSVARADTGLSVREWRELLGVLGFTPAPVIHPGPKS